MNASRKPSLLPVAAAIGLGVAGRRLLRRPAADFQGRVALITGGSRGLGLQLAREFARVGCMIAICARDMGELDRAADALRQQGATVLTIPCDVSDRDDVTDAVQQTVRRFGRVDILVNNAGIIQAGPVGSMTIADFEEAMGVIFWGTLYATLAVLPQMRERRAGHIVNITSVGGKISMPHLLPYSAAKFAATGFSEGLRAELAADDIRVTTIAPGLLRTGGQRTAQFKGNQEAEYAWFSLGDTLPFAALDTAQAAREIVDATRRGQAECILSLPASIAARIAGAFPALTADLLALVNRFVLPSGEGGSRTAAPGVDVQERESAPLQRIVEQSEGSADTRLNQPHAHTRE